MPARLFLLAVLIFAPCAIQTPSLRCGVHSPTERQFQVYRQLAILENTREKTPVRRADITVDLHIHIVTSSNDTSTQITVSPRNAHRSPAKLSAHQNQTLADQFDILSRSFTSTGISFRWRSTQRSVHPTWAAGRSELDMKGTLRKGTYDDLNLYILEKLPLALGHCTFPDEHTYANAETLDGCMVEASTLPGGSRERYNMGKTLVHEVGHWFGLLHTFQDGCTGTGDLVADTPASAGPTAGCPGSRDSCPEQPGPDPIFNYMDVSDDACLTEFTAGQVIRMHSMWNKYRG